jgi:hypothetical protein
MPSGCRKTLPNYMEESTACELVAKRLYDRHSQDYSSYEPQFNFNEILLGAPVRRPVMIFVKNLEHYLNT